MYPVDCHNLPQRSAVDPQSAERTPRSACRELPCSRSYFVGTPSLPLWAEKIQSEGVALLRGSRASRSADQLAGLGARSMLLHLHCCQSYLTEIGTH